MFSKQFLSIACALILTSEAIKCYKQTPSFLLERNDETIIDYGGISWPAVAQCGGGLLSFLTGTTNTEGYACQSSLSSGSYTRTLPSGSATEWSYETETKGCMSDLVCESLAGGTDTCQYAEYTWQRWLPLSCDADNNYDAITEDYTVTLALSCCTDEDHCNEEEDYSGCDKDDDFSNYLNELNDCWTDFKKDFMETLLCDEEDDDIFEWAYNCTNSDGTWKSSEYSNQRCRYRATCTQDLQNLLASFGGCACSAATDNDYSGEYIATAMEAAWEAWCPGIELACSPEDDLVEILFSYYVITYNIVLDVASSAITDAIKYAILNAVADALNVHNNSVTVTQDTTSRRRLQDDQSSWNVEIRASTESDADEISGNVDSSVDNDVETASGYTVSDSDTSSREENSTTTGTYDKGSAAQVNISKFVLLVTFISVFAAFMQ